MHLVCPPRGAHAGITARKAAELAEDRQLWQPIATPEYHSWTMHILTTVITEQILKQIWHI